MNEQRVDISSFTGACSKNTRWKHGEEVFDENGKGGDIPRLTITTAPSQNELAG